jgi:hypothetical protein
MEVWQSRLQQHSVSLSWPPLKTTQTQAILFVSLTDNRRAGIEETISQGVHWVPPGRSLRCCRYRGLAKTALQHIATAAAINLDRIIAWLNEIPQAKTRISRFARLAPA